MMSCKNRVFVCLFLIVFGTLIFFMTRVYESNVVKNNMFSEVNGYLPFEKVYGYKIENRERYVKYYDNNSSLSFEDVVIRVNIGLDRDFYGYVGNSDLGKGNCVLVNKYLRLDKDYVPSDLEEIDDEYFIYGNKNVRLLRSEARKYFEKLSYDSIRSGHPVYGQSAYRSYERQEELYDSASKNGGKMNADKDTARPGHSEHQTGLTIDVSSTKDGNMLNFESSDSYKWMIDNAYRYGFILRYPKGKEKIHGFVYESWHFRFVGIDVARDMHDNYSDLTFDEYYYKKLVK